MVTDLWCREIHERLLQRDPTATSELADRLLDTLVAFLAARHPELQDEELIADAATDALINYMKNPEQFDPGKRGLVGYLKMSAEGDLLNALAKRKRLNEKIEFSEDVELLADHRNRSTEPVDVTTQIEAEEASRVIDELFPDSRDRKLADLVIQGERSTDAYAEILGLDGVSPEQRRREVKRHKDRIKKRLERAREAFRKGEGSK